MKQFGFFHTKEVFPGLGIICVHVFKMTFLQDSYALLSGVNHQLSFGFALTRGRSAYFQDCFECLSPDITAA